MLATFLAACNDAIGCISPPANIPNAVDPSGKLTGVVVFINSILRLVFVVAGLWGFFNLILAGFGFLSAGGDPKNVEKAWTKIWQSLLGLLIIVASFLLAAVIGIILFKDPSAILNPRLQ